MTSADAAFWIGRFGRIDGGSKLRPVGLTIRVREEHARVPAVFAARYGGDVKPSGGYGRRRRNAMVEWRATGRAAYECLRDHRDELFDYDNYAAALKAVYNYERLGVLQ